MWHPGFWTVADDFNEQKEILRSGNVKLKQNQNCLTQCQLLNSSHFICAWIKTFAKINYSGFKKIFRCKKTFFAEYLFFIFIPKNCVFWIRGVYIFVVFCTVPQYLDAKRSQIRFAVVIFGNSNNAFKLIFGVIAVMKRSKSNFGSLWHKEISLFHVFVLNLVLRLLNRKIYYQC